ncbi:ADP-ribose phosphatase [Parastagonospora nodorum]|nr:ADP-ribose phosphatase [Parastagonospora nodorum]
MSSIRLATAANVLAFQNLTTALDTSDGKWAHLIESDGLQDEIGRFRVWSGNLGALQKGHSSLDYRLRDSPLLSTNTLKFLKELEENINEASAIVSGTRLPYELQPRPEATEEDDDDDDDFFDKDDEDDEDTGSRTELSMRFSEIVDIIDNLYKLSVRIRTPTIRTRSAKAATFKPKDPETGVDILSKYADYDLQHVKELLRYLRQPHEGEADGADYDYLTIRLSAAITLRRRQFKYWKRHRDKLGMSTVQEEETPLEQPTMDRPAMPTRNDTMEALPGTPLLVRNQDAPSQKTGKTLLSGTEATQHHQSLDEIVDTKSVTSYAVTVKDLHGKGVDLPPPPRAADSEKDFECPYCYIICPARYGRGRAWRTHLLQDLQPYVCTYPDCDSSEQLFRSRREWADHEATHRKAWRCPEHPNAIYKTSAGLEDHFQREHAESFPESQLSAIVKVGETTTVDARTTCPICSAPADIEGLGDFHNHIANHLERLATFALPNGREDDSDGASSAASRGRSESSESRDMSDLSLPVHESEKPELYPETTGRRHPASEGLDLADDHPQEAATRAILSAESLQQLPDASQERLGALFPSSGSQPDDRSRSGSGSEDSSYYVPESYAEDDERESKLNILKLADIPTIRSLYRTRRLQQRDQSFAPNDKYNRIISFCHHDLTKLKVDAIVNSANKSLKMTRGDTLNNAIHKAAGPGLSVEARLTGRLEGQALITGGHNLPSEHVIHVLRPGYFRHKGMGEFNQLIDCYREVLKVAIENKIKTIAFPCLGTGGVGFPARVAARITLQEMREYLDAHPEHNLERIIFCVNTAADEKAYIDFLPVYFPPTHDDLDSARGIWSEDYAAQAMKILDTRNEVQKVFSDLNLGMSLSVTDFPQDILNHLAAIDSSLSSIRRFLLWSNDVNKNIRDLKLVCTVLMLFCGNITEIIDLAKDHANLGQRGDKSIWDDYLADMNTRLQTTPSELLQLCRDLLEGLDNMITGHGYDLDEIMEMVETRQKLEHYKVKQRGGREGEGNQDHLNEVLLTREFQNESIAQSRDSVKLYQIRSVAQLYKLGELEEKPTQAKPSAVFNDKIYLVREDITKLEVDVMVNSTDVSFRGMGTLDRTVLQKGGEQMRAAVTAFGQCKIGEVRHTEGYMLPAKHVLHIIPADRYNGGTKIVLKKLYREVLQEAVSMRATSIALPSIGTGMLNYPRRDVASVALEEAKRFLESAERNNPVEKIIFVVFSSNDEFVYKSLMPVYFPPIIDDLIVPSITITKQDTGISATSNTSDAPRRTLFGSIGEALRSVRLGKQPEAPRPITANEEQALIRFESHAKECETCQDIDRLYLEGRDLCKTGFSRAQTVLWYMNMQSDQNVYTKPDIRGQSTKIELSKDMFPISMRMLSFVEKSHGDKTRSRPFVAQHRPYGAVIQDQAVDTPSSVRDDTAVPQGPKKSRARVLATLDSTSAPTPVSSQECHIQVYPDRVDVFQHGYENKLQWPLLSLSLNDTSVVSRLKTTPELQLDGVDRLPTSTMSETTGKLIFRCRNDNECNALLRAIRHVIVRIQASNYSVDREQVIIPNNDAGPRDEPAFIQPVKTLVQKKLAEDGDVTSLGDKVNVSSGKVSIYSGFGEDGEFPVLLTLQLHASSTIQQYTKWAEITLAGAIHSPSFFNTEGDVTFICKNNEDRDVLFLRIQREITRLQGPQEARDEETTVASTGDFGEVSSSEHVQWSERLSDIRSELAGIKRASGGLSDLQYKMERLSTATVTLGTNAQAASDASKLFDPSRSELATRILLCLTADLKSRPGSYIGLDTSSIVAAVRAEEQEVKLALMELVDQDQVHNTMDESTWVVTHPPENLPALAGEELESGPHSADVTYDAPMPDEAKAPGHGPTTRGESVMCNACDILLPNGSLSPPTRARPEVALQDLSSTVQAVYHNVVEASKGPAGGVHTLHIAQSTGRPRVEVENALAILNRCGFVHTHGEWWAATTRFQQSDGKEGEAEGIVETAVSDARDALSEPATSGPSTSNDATPAQKGKEPNSSDQTGSNITPEQSVTNRPQVQLNPTTEKVYTYLLNYTFAPPDGAHHILDIAAAVYLTREEVRQALAELKELGLANVSGKNGWWWATKADAPQPPGEEGRDQSLPSTTPAVTVSDKPAPQAHTTSPDPLDLDTITITSHIRYTQPFGSRSAEARWTRIDRRLLAQRVLVAANEEFHHADEDIVFHRVVPRSLLERWFEETKALRKKDGGGRRGSEALEQDQGEGRSKGKERERRDVEQERLDRVIAGDMKEDEMRRYEDEKDAQWMQRRHM